MPFGEFMKYTKAAPATITTRIIERISIGGSLHPARRPHKSLADAGEYAEPA
jgi:hypothetical protein